MVKTVWLSSDDIAERLTVSRRTAMGMMYLMPYSVISGTVRKRIRVSEQDFETWMAKHGNGYVEIPRTKTGSVRRLERR